MSTISPPAPVANPSPFATAPSRAPRPVLTRGVVYAWAALLALLITGMLVWWSLRPRHYALRMSAGDRLGRRQQIAEVLARATRNHDVSLALVETEGSARALELVSQGRLECALIQGGIGSAPHVREVAILVREPLHLLVKREIIGAVRRDGLRALRGKSINLSKRGSGTRSVAALVLDFADMRAGRDFTDEDASYQELESRAYARLPDAIFMVSLVPSPVVARLARTHGYALAPIPLARSLALRHGSLHEASIPAYAYGLTPAPCPPADIATVGTDLLLVARDTVPDDAIRRLLEATFAGGFAREAILPGLSEARFLDAPEMPIHPAAVAFRDRNAPFITSNLVQGIEGARSLILSAGLAFFFVYRWFRQRRYAGFDYYLREVTRVERSALALETQAAPSAGDILHLRNELGELKTEALEKYARGELRGEELMSAFLAHVTDVRGYLSALILTERERKAGAHHGITPGATKSHSAPTPPRQRRGAPRVRA